MDNLDDQQNSSIRKTTRLVLFVLLIIFLGGLLFWQKDILLRQNSPPKKIENLEKRKTSNGSLPEAFSSNIPEVPESQVVEAYSLFDHSIGKTTDGVIVLSSSKNGDEIRKFYQEKLTPPDFVLVQGSDKSDTEALKILVYSTKTGIVIVKIEKTASGSKITLRDSNLLVKTTNIK